MLVNYLEQCLQWCSNFPIRCCYYSPTKPRKHTKRRIFMSSSLSFAQRKELLNDNSIFIHVSNSENVCSQCMHYFIASLFTIILLFVINIKTYISYLVHTTRFWNNIHQVRSKSKYLILMLYLFIEDYKQPEGCKVGLLNI